MGATTIGLRTRKITSLFVQRLIERLVPRVLIRFRLQGQCPLVQGTTGTAYIFNIHILNTRPDSKLKTGRVYLNLDGEKRKGGLVRAPRIGYDEAHKYTVNYSAQPAVGSKFGLRQPGDLPGFAVVPPNESIRSGCIRDGKLFAVPFNLLSAAVGDVSEQHGLSERA